jgi:hypothetical protein
MRLLLLLTIAGCVAGCVALTRVPSSAPATSSLAPVSCAANATNALGLSWEVGQALLSGDPESALSSLEKHAGTPAVVCAVRATQQEILGLAHSSAPLTDVDATALAAANHYLFHEPELLP